MTRSIKEKKTSVLGSANRPHFYGKSLTNCTRGKIQKNNRMKRGCEKRLKVHTIARVLNGRISGWAKGKYIPRSSVSTFSSRVKGEETP